MAEKDATSNKPRNFTDSTGQWMCKWLVFSEAWTLAFVPRAEEGGAQVFEVGERDAT